jgi:hypothetical protein
MEANELRIGNYLKTDRECQDDYVEVVEIYNENYFCTCSAGLNYQKEHVKPILLTEEWFIKFGFVIHNKPNGYTEYIKYKQGTKQYLHKLYTFKVSDNDWGGKFAFSGTIQTKLKHVHELQNLYFALNNEELTIK